MLLILISVFCVLGVVVVVVSWLLSLSIVNSYLLVTGTVFPKYVQVRNAVHGWRIRFLGVVNVILLDSFGSGRRFLLFLALILFVCFVCLLCFIVCHNVVWVVVVLCCCEGCVLDVMRVSFVGFVWFRLAQLEYLWITPTSHRT